MKNRTIWEAFPALVELNACKVPGLVAIRLGMNVCSLRPLYDVLEKQQKVLVVEYKVSHEFADDPEVLVRRAAYDKAWDALLDDEATEWTPAAKIEARRLMDVKEFWCAAQLLAAGILVDMGDATA